MEHKHLCGSLLGANSVLCNSGVVAGDKGLNLVVKPDVPEYMSEALPDLIQSVPARRDDSTENKVLEPSFTVYI